ncbi:glutamyl-tRNA reductase [Pengzhenrongella sicca]|uniref:Glutamyl-tRNA reductase n=1 Tax=Pengzhenrongella sicca TaxID=2819238 RepID=A0A8A4ZEW7_9MICO|nr:glutamyl-tRNA reductase [Pengzhenrongella sicca]QTE29453.1 glutamyl-tRNA reductase [Pengzhenrongella sicca]
MSLIASHRDLDLDVLERLSADAHSVGRAVAADGAAQTGAVVLATCNRFEIYLEVAPGQEAAAATAATAVVAAATGLRAADVSAHLRVLSGDEVPAHLFAVAAGLDSMVVGEREISGQVRRALTAARADGTTSSGLERLFQSASRASRDVGTRTGLGAAGRSVVGVALDLAEPDLPPWAQTRVVLVGTGSYAGASLAALRRRGCRGIRVYSPSGRAAVFAQARDAVAVAEGGLADAVATADLVVACSGAAGGVLDAETVAHARAATGHPRVVVDLALRHDVEPTVGDLPGVRLIDLATVREQAPPEHSEPVEQARALIRAASSEFESARGARERDALIAIERRRVLGPLEAESARIRATARPEDAADRAVRTLRRRTRTQLHAPTVRARAAARAGDGQAFAAALAELASIPSPPVPPTA